jgi:phosphatidylcholine synthase
VPAAVVALFHARFELARPRVAAYNILVFVPVKYVYPSRNTRLRRVTLILTYLYGGIGVWGLMQYPSVPQWIVWISLIYVAYYVLLSFFPKIGSIKPA